MNIVLATDNNFVQHCTVAILSILKDNKCVHFFVLTEGLEKENIQYLKDIVESKNSILSICDVPSDIVKCFPMSSLASCHISIATYYRLFITSLLPKTINKVLYLDCDMVIRGNLKDLWDTDISGYAMGAVYQDFGWSDHNDCWNRLGIPRETGYFNAGCLLMNLEYLRNISFQSIAVEYINKNFNRIISHDQDVLNAILYNKTKILSCKWNYISLFLNNNLKKTDFPQGCNYVDEKSQTGFEPIIVHFVSKPKPWHYGCSNPYTPDYYYYLSQTKWRDFSPTFFWKQYFDFIIIPRIKKFIKKNDYWHITEKRHLRKVRNQYMS